jgi:hypothetical protein
MKDSRQFIKTTIREFLNEQINDSIKWVKPDFKTEKGEFTGHFFHWMEDDVLQTDFETYLDEDLDGFWDKIEYEYNNAKVELLSDDDWLKMENTDSWNIHTENDLFDVVHALGGRDKERIINYALKPIKEGGIVETPIVAYADRHPPYLVAGNTRLSVCRMLGIRPMVTKLIIK